VQGAGAVHCGLPVAFPGFVLRGILKSERNRIPKESPHAMDIPTIDQQYEQMQAASQQVVQELKDLAAKLQTEQAAGNANAREWLLDLREIALAIQQQQQQTANLLQAIHGFVANQNQAYAQPVFGQPGMGAPMQPQGGLGGFLNSGFGRAVTMGLGFGLGDDLINKIF